MDEQHLAAALRYVSLNPVRARLVERAQDWRWSSTSAHLRGRDDGLTARASKRLKRNDTRCRPGHPCLAGFARTVERVHARSFVRAADANRAE